MSSTRAARARLEASLGARVVGRRPLLYTHGADASLDRPPHVRAGSGLARVGTSRLAVVQDDASFLAIADLESAHVEAIALPLLADRGTARQFDDARGNKKKKLDLEACFVTSDGTVVAFGSGSSPLREQVVLVRGADVRIADASELYAQMRADAGFSGSELNVEGAAVDGHDIVFFQRGNGAGSAVDATARVERAALLAHLDGAGPCPAIRDVFRWDLGTSAEGVRFTFTDGAATPRGSFALAFLACAEASADAVSDGPVSGVAIGRLDDRTGTCELGEITDERGAPLLDKAEGLAFEAGAPARAWVVVDKDDPSVPSELLEIALGPGWR